MNGIKEELGNVQATVSDRRVLTEDPSDSDPTHWWWYADVISAQDYYPFGMQMPDRIYQQGEKGYRYGFNGKERDDEWNGVGNAYNFVANAPIIAIDPDGEDIVFIVDEEAAAKQGHGAVLIGSETDGWTYASMNGTGEGANPYGKAKNPDVGTPIVDANGNKITNLEEAIKRANVINPKEEHTYDSYKSVASSKEEDKMALRSANRVARSEWYGVCGPGKSCQDVMQTAFATLVVSRGLTAPFWHIWNKTIPGSSEIIPNRWIDKLETYVQGANEYADDDRSDLYGSKKEREIVITGTGTIDYSDDNSSESVTPAPAGSSSSGSSNSGTSSSSGGSSSSSGSSSGNTNNSSSNEDENESL